MSMGVADWRRLYVVLQSICMVGALTRGLTMLTVVSSNFCVALSFILPRVCSDYTVLG
jgi:hypothetical protein